MNPIFRMPALLIVLALVSGPGLSGKAFGQSAPATQAEAAPTPSDAASAAEPVPAAKQKTKSPKASTSKTPASVVITVGPNKIRRRQIDTLVDLMVRVKKAPERMEPRERLSLERMIATNLIGQELLELEAKRLNVVAENKDIDSMTKVFRANFPSDQAFSNALKQAGDTEKGLREKMARQIKADKLLNAQLSQVGKPDPAEMQAFFTANKAAFPINDSLRACQIVFLLDKNAGSQETAKRKAELEKIRADLAKDSGEFETLLTRFVYKARDVSEGPEKKDGGDLQRFHPGDFFPEFKKQVSALKVGRMSTVFRTPLGMHLVLLTERNDGKFESYRLQVANAVTQQKSAKAGKDLKKYLKTLSERYHVTYLEQNYRDSSLAGVYGP